MLKRIEILVEEPSMEAVLKELLPKILPAPWELGVNCFIRSHEGKSDLKKSIPKKMKVFPISMSRQALSFYMTKTQQIVKN